MRVRRSFLIVCCALASPNSVFLILDVISPMISAVEPATVRIEAGSRTPSTQSVELLPCDRARWHPPSTTVHE